MDEQPGEYAVGHGKPPVETRFRKGQSGNPGGRPRGARKLVTLLGEALSRRSGFANADGSWMTQAEAIFASLVGQAMGADLKAKRADGVPEGFPVLVAGAGRPVRTVKVERFQDHATLPVRQPKGRLARWRGARRTR